MIFRQDRTLFAGVLATLALFALILGASACNQNQRADTLRATVITVNVARDGFAAWDKVKQGQIIDAAISKEAGAAALVTYRTSREKVVASFELTYKALALAATALEDDVQFSAAMTAVKDLEQAIQTFRGAP